MYYKIKYIETIIFTYSVESLNRFEIIEAENPLQALEKFRKSLEEGVRIKIIDIENIL